MIRAIAVPLLVLLVGIACDAEADVLITKQEAALPGMAGGPLTFRGVTRGPKVDLVLPIATSGEVKSPIELKIRFQTFGGAKVDSNSVNITLLKAPVVDLTQRMRKFIQPEGIEMPNAELPPGEHLIRVEIKDTEGRMGSTTFALRVMN